MSISTQVAQTPTTLHQDILNRRMKGPQRHRLLQGYPMPPLMVDYDRSTPYQPVELDSTRPLIVGVLPHASCNPTVRGCGYCTFPHEEFQVSSVKETVRAVIEEIKRTDLGAREVPALYLGGGTANLTPPDVFTELCQTLARTFHLDRAEVTLEGAPVFFTARKEALLNILETELPCPHKRLSMGVQTFDPSLIEKMGRQAIGNPKSVAAAVKAAKRRRMTTSADLMINMPGQTLAQMQQDLRTASDLGFSQVCIYHLVLFRGLGTPWAGDRDMLNALPDNQRAFENWLAVTELAQELGYKQKTLTNFEREGYYRYEECSYHPERFDGVGFGPEALSGFTQADRTCGVKWMNESSSGDYRQAVDTHGHARSKVFVYGARDLRILFLTRTLPRLSASRRVYSEMFGSDLIADFREPLEALSRTGLVAWDQDSLKLTRMGMFFSDSVGGLLAHDRIGELRRGIRGHLNDPPVFRMG